MPGPRGSGSKRAGTATTLNGHANHSLIKKRSQRFDVAPQSPLPSGRRNSVDVDVRKPGAGDSTERDSDAKAPPESSTSNTSGPIPRDSTHSSIVVTDSTKRIHVGQSPESPFTKLTYGSVLPPHQYLDSLAITFFLVNLPTIFLVLIHILFIVFAVSPYSPTSSDRYSSWKTILPAEVFIILFFSVVSPTIRAYITELAEPVIASTLAGSGGRGTIICAAVMFAAGRVPDVVLGGFIRLKRYSPGALSDTIVLTANDMETESEALDRLGDELQAWVLALIRQLIAIHVVARWSWEGLKRYLTNRVNQSKLEDSSASSNVDAVALAKRKKLFTPPSTLSRMPLWTTIANNYIVATKDAELKPPEDMSLYMLENECSLHVREITPCCVRLCAKGPRHKLMSSLGSIASFDVCVNGLQWREVSISFKENDHSDYEAMCNHDPVSLFLDIHSLTPSTANEVEVTNSSLPHPSTVLFHATICTIQKEDTTTPTLAPQTVRPNSPISTLTDKLNNAIESLNELRNNQRRIRKDHKSTVASLRSEIDVLHSRLEAPDKGEERARRGNLALKYQIMQTDGKIRKLEDEIQVAEEAISNRQEQLIGNRGKWESERLALENSHRSQIETKSSHNKVLQQFHAEKLAINARKEKLTSREVKLKGELEALEAAERKRHEESDGRAKKRKEARIQLIKERQTTQAEQILAVEQMETQLAEVKERTARTHAERLALENVPVISLPQVDITISGPLASPISSGSQDGPVKENDSNEKVEGSQVENSSKEAKGEVVYQ
jgi:hypothetical protein